MGLDPVDIRAAQIACGNARWGVQITGYYLVTSITMLLAWIVVGLSLDASWGITLGIIFLGALTLYTGKLLYEAVTHRKKTVADYQKLKELYL